MTVKDLSKKWKDIENNKYRYYTNSGVSDQNTTANVSQITNPFGHIDQIDPGLIVNENFREEFLHDEKLFAKKANLFMDHEASNGLVDLD